MATLILSFGPLSRLPALGRSLIIGLVFGVVMFLARRPMPMCCPGPRRRWMAVRGLRSWRGPGRSAALVTFAIAALARLALDGPNVVPGLVFLAGFALVGLMARAAEARGPFGHVSTRALVICLAGYLVVQLLPRSFPVIIRGEADLRGGCALIFLTGDRVGAILVTAGVTDMPPRLQPRPAALESLPAAHRNRPCRRPHRHIRGRARHRARRLRPGDVAALRAGAGAGPAVGLGRAHPPRGPRRLAEGLAQARAGAQGGQVEFRYQGRWLRNRILAHWFTEAATEGQPARIMGVHVDLTEIRAREAQLRTQTAIANTAQKDAAIGKLSGGIAHDFNNILAVILGNLELLALREDARRKR